MTGVIATLVAHNIVNTAAEQIGSFAFSFVAPLSADEHDGWHYFSLSCRTGCITTLKE
jgi:hypothetical protein